MKQLPSTVGTDTVQGFHAVSTPGAFVETEIGLITLAKCLVAPFAILTVFHY